MNVLDRWGIRATVAMDALVAEGTPFLVRECQTRDWEFVGHGVSFSRLISAAMDERVEREYIARALGVLERMTGRRPEGWLGPDYGASPHTLELLAEYGVRYVCDWPNDEQPYRLNVREGEMISLPVTLELDDVFTHRSRSVPIGDWSRMVIETFDRLCMDGATAGRLLVLNLHPYLIGQPFRTPYLERAIAHIAGAGQAWIATGNEIVSWYRGEYGPGGDAQRTP
jgi:peptidoglycan/xylan/chitin deacetylase (PgdA/CDA1 family)